jgi:hypothetical protein
MKKVILSLIVALLILTSFALFGASADADDLPDLVFLGTGPETFTTPLDNFIIKIRPFDFDWRPGPTYQANDGQRVWGVRGANEKPPRLWHEEVNLGAVKAGCVAGYVGIDDDIDDRINFFLLDGEMIETVTQGMVFSGSFVIPRDGNLVFVANDSVGGWFEKCTEEVEPTETPTSTATGTPLPTDTATPGPSPTATNTPLPTDTATPGPSPTATATVLPPTATITVTPAPTATQTRRPREPTCLRINFDVGGESAARGLYVVQEIGGHVLASWYALEGWQDSGWFYDIDITHENVYVQVLYYRGPDTEPIELKILNHAPDSPYGWLSWGMCHALEVAWPDEKPEGASDTPADASQAAESVEQQVEQVQPAPVTVVEEDDSPTESTGTASLRR